MTKEPFTLGEFYVCVAATTRYFTEGEIYQARDKPWVPYVDNDDPVLLSDVDGRYFRHDQLSSKFELLENATHASILFDGIGPEIEDVEDEPSSALQKQTGGDHYKQASIQPVEFIHANNMNFFEGSAVKYIARHRRKGGEEDLLKAIHFLEMLIEMEYPDEWPE